MTEHAKTTDSVISVKCPRCGYDQRGVMATWVETCPIESVCSECGLRLRSADLIGEQWSQLKWCIESARSWVDIPMRSVRTVVMMFQPWRFWSDLKLSHEFRPCKVASMLIMIAVLIYALAAIRTAAMFGASISTAKGHGLLKAASVGYALAFPYSTDPPSWLVRSPYMVSLDGFTRRMPPHATVPGDFVWTWDEHLDWFGDVHTSIVTRELQHITRASWVVILGVVSLSVPFAFTSLSMTRNRIRIRWRHAWRIAAYSLAIPFMLIGAELLLDLVELGLSRFRLFNLVWRVQALIVFPCGFILLWLWWTVAARRYLMLPHAIMTVCMVFMLVMVVLAFMVVFVSMVCNA